MDFGADMKPLEPTTTNSIPLEPIKMFNNFGADNNPSVKLKLAVWNPLRRFCRWDGSKIWKKSSFCMWDGSKILKIEFLYVRWIRVELSTSQHSTSHKYRCYFIQLVFKYRTQHSTALLLVCGAVLYKVPLWYESRLPNTKAYNLLLKNNIYTVEH